MKQEVKYQAPSQPNQLRLDTTTACPARCLSCHRFNTNRGGRMDMSLIREVLDDVARWPMPLQEIVPVNYGEVFIRKDWPDILNLIAKKLPLTRIVIPTTGYLLDPETVSELSKIKTVRILNFSINAYFDETYKAFTGLPPSTLEKAETAIKLMRILRPDIDIRVSMVFDPMYQSDLERDLFETYWRRIANSVWILPAASASRSTKMAYIERSEPCRSIFSDIVVGFDRKISSCCFDPAFEIPLGEYQGDLLSNWNGPELTLLRKIHNEGDRGQAILCGACTFA